MMVWEVWRKHLHGEWELFDTLNVNEKAARDIIRNYGVLHSENWEWKLVKSKR